MAPPRVPTAPRGPQLLLQQRHQRPHPRHHCQPLGAKPGHLQGQCHLRGWSRATDRGHTRSYEGRTLLQDSLSSRQTPYVVLSSRPSGWGCSENSSELNRWDLGHHGGGGGVEAWDLGLLRSPGKSSSGVPEGSREMNGSWDEIWSQ